MAFLHDSIQNYKAPTNYTIRGYLEGILDAHNSQVEEYKKIYLGTIDNSLDSNNNTYKGISYDTTYANIKSDLLEVYGGVMYLTYDEADKTYLNYIKYQSLGINQDKPIQLSYNMIDVDEDVDTSELFTRLYPLGAYDNDTNTTRVNISSINNGKMYIDNEDAIREWGIIPKVEIWDNVTDKYNLKNKAETYLNNNCVIKMSTKVNAVERSLINSAYPNFKIGDTYLIQNGLLGLKYRLRLYAKSIDLQNYHQPELQFGDKNYSLINWQNKKNNELAYKSNYESINKDTPEQTEIDTSATSVVCYCENNINYVFDTLNELTIVMGNTLPATFISTIQFKINSRLKFKQDEKLWLSGDNCINGAFIPVPGKEYKITINTIANDRFEGFVEILNSTAVNWNLNTFSGANQLVINAMTYNLEDNKARLRYGYKTPLSRNDRSYYTNSDGTMNIDCSTFTGFAALGRNFNNSPYANHSNGITPNTSYTWSRELPRNAANQAKYFIENGLYFTDPNLLQAGDFIFWITRTGDNTRVQGRFGEVSHVAICVGLDNDNELCTVESTTIANNPVYYRKFKNNYPDKVFCFGRLNG